MFRDNTMQGQSSVEFIDGGEGYGEREIRRAQEEGIGGDLVRAQERSCGKGKAWAIRAVAEAQMASEAREGRLKGGGKGVGSGRGQGRREDVQGCSHPSWAGGGARPSLGMCRQGYF